MQSEALFLRKTNNIHTVRLSKPIFNFQEEMISTGRFKDRSAVTIYAYQKLMESEGYTLKKEENGKQDPRIERMATLVRHLHIDYKNIKLMKSDFISQSTLKKDWLASHYPKLLKLTTQEFIDHCLSGTLAGFLGVEE